MIKCLSGQRPKLLKALFLVVIVFLPVAVQAKNYVWLIGGGPYVSRSQASIEDNVKWLMDILESSANEYEVRTYFNDGTSDAKDIVYAVKREESKAEMQPLARVFGKHLANQEMYRNHEISNVQGSTRKKELQKSLEKDFSRLANGDKAIIIFNGHGLKYRDEDEGNRIRLWGDETLSVRELEALLSIIPPDVPVRFVFPQCYSGGFARLINSGAKDELTLDRSIRCGFFAQSARRESEG